ncbi:MAG: DUF2750 domain-containing protein [Anaerolineae bacterium]|nr:DUF2750 domain-containing protein [Candidatus Roseilinea sp.]MDW8451351.1 DUF2750 domain-containing protein [Anaerolineae bacterium]
MAETISEMSWKINDKEISSVLALPPAQRYEYFVKKVADFEELWGLADERGWAVYRNEPGQELFPVWPHPQYAAKCAIDAFARCLPRRITLREWLESWLPQLLEEKRLVAVLPSPDNRAVFVTPDRLLADLVEELSNVGGLSDDEGR